MSGAPTPQFLPKAFAATAAPTFINTIPDTTVTPGRASWTLGFPPVTMTPKIAGGVPPFGQDVNGVLYALSTHAVAQQAGQSPVWSALIAAAIGGYAVGTVLGSTDGLTKWFNILDANVSNPDANGAGWVPLYAPGTRSFTVTGGTLTLTTTEAARYVLVFGGTLAANQAVNLPNNRVGPWLIVNNTTGSFSLTVKTSAGAGVAIPQGGFAEPVQVYGDGTNIYRTDALLSIPSAVAPTPDTYVVRSNAGYVFATYLNQNSGVEPGAALVNVFIDQGDGYLRKKPIANFLGEIFVSPALTGVPTAPTAAPGTNDATIASTAYVQAAIALGITYGGKVNSAGAAIALPAGWTSTRIGAGRYTITHNIGVTLAAVPTVNMAGSADDRYANILGENVNSFTIEVLDVGAGAVDNAVSFIAKVPG